MLIWRVMSREPDIPALLAWYLDAGVDETIDEVPHDRYAESAAPAAPAANPAPASQRDENFPVPATTGTPETAPGLAEAPAPPPTPPGSDLASVDTPRAIAQACASLEAIRAALETFEGCALKKTATHTVIGDGNPASKVMLIGEAPGAEEDRRGLPFVGKAGQLLDRMLTAIGLDRSTVYITNVLPWRPPGNRSPTPEEVATCLPFLERQIELIDPALLVFVGGISAKALLGRTEGITRLRGKWYDFEVPGRKAPIPATAIFHPAYLLRQPVLKREAWHDLQEIRRHLDRAV